MPSFEQAFQRNSKILRKLGLELCRVKIFRKSTFQRWGMTPKDNEKPIRLFIEEELTELSSVEEFYQEHQMRNYTEEEIEKLKIRINGLGTFYFKED